MHYLHLMIAIVAEVIATSFMKQSAEFTKPLPTVVMGAGYATAFYFLALTLRSMPTGIAYAIWSASGIILIAIVAWIFQGQKLDTAAIVGMAFIVAGVLIMNMFSTSIRH